MAPSSGLHDLPRKDSQASQGGHELGVGGCGEEVRGGGTQMTVVRLHLRFFSVFPWCDKLHLPL